METNITTAPAQNHTQSHHHYHHNNIHPSTATLIMIIPILIIIPLFSFFLIFVILRRVKFMNLKNCFFIAHKTIHINDSPDVVKGGGCLYGGKSEGRVGVAACKSEGVQVLTYKEVEVATNSFSEANVIGDTGFGHVVYRGVLRDGTVAAIKALRREGKHSERAFRLEVDLLNRLSSPYLVKMLGYCADQNHRLLIFEFMPNGTLHHHLHPAHPHRHQPLDWPTRLRIALDCARGLEFLHDHALPSIIHRDFNCATILLDHNFRAKISHFGLAKAVSDQINGHILTRVLGTTGYLAPEYASTGKLTAKSDVYSYGVVLLELLTGRGPVDHTLPPGEHLLVPWALPRLTNREKLAQMVDPALQGRYSKKELVQVAAIAAMCVQPEADYRPLMADVVQSLIPLVKNLSAFCTSNSFGYNQAVCLWP